MNWKTQLVITILIIAQIALGAFGVYPHLVRVNGFENWTTYSEALYRSIQLFAISFPDNLFSDPYKQEPIGWILQITRLTAPIFTLSAVLAIFSGWIRKTLFRNHTRYRYNGHAIVYGFNLRSKLLYQDLKKRNVSVVVVSSLLTDEDEHWLRKMGIRSFKLHGTDPIVPKICAAHKAKYLFAVYDDDSTNMKILLNAHKRNRDACYKTKNKYKTTCYVHFTGKTYQNIKLGAQFSIGEHGFFKAKIFSVYDLAGKQAAQTIYKKYAPKCFVTNTGINFYVFGLTNTGKATVENLIRLSYFKKKYPITITIFDPDESKWKHFADQYPVLSPDEDHYEKQDAERIQLLKEKVYFPQTTFHQLSFDDARLRRGTALVNQANPKNNTNIAILALDDATENLALAELIYQQQTVPLQECYIRFDDPSSEVSSRIKYDIGKRGFYEFPSHSKICNTDFLEDHNREIIAEKIHQNYADSESTAETWSDQSETLKESNRQQASHIEIKCAIIGIYDLDIKKTAKLAQKLNEIEKTIVDDLPKRLAEVEHNRWCTETLFENLIPAKKKNRAQYLHNNLVPWDLEGISQEGPFSGFSGLDAETRAKDSDPIREIPNLIRHLIVSNKRHTELLKPARYPII